MRLKAALSFASIVWQEYRRGGLRELGRNVVQRVEDENVALQALCVGAPKVRFNAKRKKVEVQH